MESAGTKRGVPSMHLLLEPNYGGAKVDMSTAQRDAFREAAVFLKNMLYRCMTFEHVSTPKKFEKFLNDVGIVDICEKPSTQIQKMRSDLILAKSLAHVVLAQIDAYDAAGMWGFTIFDYELFDLFKQIGMLQRAMEPMMRVPYLADFFRGALGEEDDEPGGEQHPKKLDYLRYAVFARKSCLFSPNDYYSKWRSAIRAWNSMLPQQRDAWCIETEVNHGVK